MIPIFKQYPTLKKKLAYTPLGDFPTPIRHLDKLGKEVGNGRLYLKNDGLSSRDYGGNKVRKLEFILGDALRKEAQEVFTFGFAGSNHALATAVHSRTLGFKCTLMLIAQPNAQYVRRNLLFSQFCGATAYHFRSEMAAYLPAVVKFFTKKLKHGKFPYIVDPGGSSPIGTIGYVNAGFELNEQIAQGLMPQPDKIFVPLGSMGTAVGLTIGLKAVGLKTKVIAVRVVDEKYANRKKFVRLFKKTQALIHSLDPSFPKVDIRAAEIEILHGFFGREYARFTEQGMAAVDLTLKSEGIRLDGTYTGKTMAALIHQIKDQGRCGEVILFWNTYNARSCSDIIGGIDYHQLPRSFHSYFEEDVQLLDKEIK